MVNPPSALQPVWCYCECICMYTCAPFYVCNHSLPLIYNPLTLTTTQSGLGESSTLEPTNPYSAAKAGAEMLAKAYITSYNLPVIITRGNNVYGTHQFPEKLIPKFILRAYRGLDLCVHGDGMSTRSYMYVEDVADAYITVLHRGSIGETYNIGTQQERTVLSVAADIAKHFNMDEAKITHVKDRAFNDRRYFICDKKLHALGWKEMIGWEEGLRRTIDWYLTHQEASYWNNGDLEAALQPHPTMRLT